MSKKDYILIASVLKRQGATQQMVEAFANELASTNPAFNRSRFIVAAGGVPGMTIEIYKPDLKEFLDIAVEAKRAYWDANRDVELMFSDDKGDIPDKVANAIEDTISILAAPHGDVSLEDAEYLLTKVRGAGCDC